ncbi:MAG: ABC transporter permease [Chloroflexi bacterium]|nr:ABC transporter permease [Chloroflexota bacterium]
MFLRLIKEKPLGTAGALIIFILFFTGIFADLLAPFGFNESNMADRLSPPSGTHILGTDNLGRDLLSRIIYGARISMIVSLASSGIATIGQLILGTISGYAGGKVDLALQRVNDSIQSIPSLLIVLSVMAILGPGMIQVILVMGLHSALTFRGTRAFVINIKENMYFEAARAIGVQDSRIVMRHVIPNIMPMVIIQFSLAMGRFILQEATLSFLGFGIPPPFPSWGGMLSGAGRQYMLQAPWMLLWPGIALFLVVYGVNMFGDAMRDLLDPRLRGGLGRYGSLSREQLEKLIEKKKAKATA